MQLVEEDGGGDCMEDLIGGREGVDMGVEPIEALIEALAGGAFGEELADHGVNKGICEATASHSKLRVRGIWELV